MDSGFADPVAQERIDELCAERDRLLRWKDEAFTVMDGLQELGRALGIPLGQSCSGPAALAEVLRLRARLRRVELVWAEHRDAEFGSMTWRLVRDMDAALHLTGNTEPR